ncbi:MAG: pentapeptide repeat-containing protein [Desertifilum sp. SIO1I2]|nr:pentapeptide repeat-containing protein [Desertifilum sp. SIO1I2]
MSGENTSKKAIYLIIIKLIFLLELFAFATISGLLSGFTANFLSKALVSFNDRQDIIEVFIFIFTLLFSIQSFIFENIKLSFAKTIGILTLTTVFIPVILFFSSILIGATFLSFILACISFFQIFFVTERYSKNTSFIITCLITITAAATSYSLDGYSDVPRNISANNFALLTIGIGLGIGLLISGVSFNLTRYDINRPIREDLKFLRDWALIITTWGGTSFYNLDLSGVDFSGSNLAHTDFRAQKLYRTCLRNVKGLNRARVDNRYFDLENPKVQNLLTQERSNFSNFSYLNLQGAYLQNAIMHSFTFIETNLNGADLKGADLQGSILVRAEVLGADFSGANLTGVCIEDWGVNSKTLFTNVQCDYVYRKLDEQGKPTNRFPVSRNFEPREFESLYQQVGNVVELIFQEGENWQAALFSLKKLQIEDEELGLELKGIEKRGDLWVVKVTHNEAFPRQEVELRLNSAFDEMRFQLAAKEQQINRLLGIVEDQAAALKNYSKQPLGTSNSFFIVGSTITNLSASGQIDYQEAVSQVRNVVANNSNLAEADHLAQSLLTQLQNQNVAPTPLQQAELIEQLIVLEAQKDAFFKQIFVQQGQQFAAAMPDSAITTAIRNAIAQLTPR